MAGEIVGSLISRVLGAGASANGQHAFVNVELNNEPGDHHLIFEVDKGHAIVTSMMAAVASAEYTVAQATGQKPLVVPFLADSFLVSIGNASDGSDGLMLTVAQSTGAQLHFYAPRAAMERLHSALGKALAGGGREEPLN